MVYRSCLFFCVSWCFVTPGWSWDALSIMRKQATDPKEYIFKNEYVFGACKSKKNTKLLYHHVHVDFTKVQKAAIIREHLWYIKRLPRCTILRASSYETDTFRVTSYNFEICVVRVNFCYTKRRTIYYYYEWYIPEDLVSGLSWDIYFYGPEGADWLNPPYDYRK